MTVNMPPATMLALLRAADYEATAGWIGDALRTAGSFVAEADRQYGPDHEVTRTAVAYRDAIAREHYNTASTRYDPAALHTAYLTARGALADLDDRR